MTEYLQMSSIILSQYLLSSHTQRQQKDTLIVSRNYDVREYFISKVCNHFLALNIPKKFYNFDLQEKKNLSALINSRFH